ncbi:hypothetical protein KAR91_70275 [Candidatus Pacearchaeota archaeon]|nr:hypothetical protein [Candidatus Pacearchaeota archaeon]
MGSSQLLTELRDIIDASAELKVFTQNLYSKDPKIFLGEDLENPAEQADFPVIVIYAVERGERGESDNKISYDAEIGCGIVNSTVTTSGQKVTLPGIVEVEQFREAVEDAIFKAQATFTALVNIDILGGTISNVLFPIFRSDTVIRFAQRRTSRNPLGR